jgi:hypothetical protein
VNVGTCPRLCLCVGRLFGSAKASAVRCAAATPLNVKEGLEDGTTS